MSEVKIEKPEAVPAPKEAPVVKTEAPVKKVSADEKWVGENTVPCNWNVVGEGGENISATNSITGLKFQGTVAQFSANLRG